MIINLTPHAIRIRVSASIAAENDPADIVIESGGLARVGTRSTVCGYIDDVPILRTEYTGVTGLPDPVEGTTYVVSLLVLQALPDRKDLVGPATGPNDGVVRTADGRVYAVRAWQKW